MYPKAITGNRPVHFHVHTHHHPPARVKKAPLRASPSPQINYVNASTQVDAAQLANAPWRVKASQLWLRARPVALWLGEAAVFIISRVSFGFGYGVSYVPFLGHNASLRANTR